MVVIGCLKPITPSAKSSELLTKLRAIASGMYTEEYTFPSVSVLLYFVSETDVLQGTINFLLLIKYSFLLLL